MISILYRAINVNRYVKKSTLDSTYSEKYKLKYSNHLKGECILTSLIIGIIRLSEQYIHIVFALAIGVIMGICLKPIFGKYYPKPFEQKDNL